MIHITAQGFVEKYPEFLARKDKSQTFSQQFSSLFTGDLLGLAPQGSITEAQADAFAEAAEKAGCVALECDAADDGTKFTGTLAGGTLADFVAGQVKWGYFVSSGLGAYFAFDNTLLGKPGAVLLGLLAGFVAGYANFEQAKGAIHRMLKLPEGGVDRCVKAVKICAAIYLGAPLGGGLMPNALSGQIEAFLEMFAPTLPASQWSSVTKTALNCVTAPSVFGFNGFVGWSTGELVAQLYRRYRKGHIEEKLADAFPTLSPKDQAAMIVRYQTGRAEHAWKERPGWGGDDVFYGMVSALLGIICTSTSVEMIKDGLFWIANSWEWALPGLSFGEFTIPLLGVLASPVSVLPVIGIMAAYLPFVRQGGAAFMDMLRDTFSSRLPLSLRTLCFAGSVFGDACTLVVGLLGVIAVGGNPTTLGTIAFGAGLANHIMIGRVVAGYLTEKYYGLDQEELTEKVTEIAAEMSKSMLAQAEIKELMQKRLLTEDEEARLATLHQDNAAALLNIKNLEEGFTVPTVLLKAGVTQQLSAKFANRTHSDSEGTSAEANSDKGAGTEVEAKAGDPRATPAAVLPKIKVNPAEPACSWPLAFLRGLTGGFCSRRQKVSLSEVPTASA